jgi:rhamnogalacturonyl hydrolase YesR
MSKTVHFIIALFVIFLIAQSFQINSTEKSSDFITENINFAARQYGLQTEIIEKSGEVLNPKSIIDGKMKYIRPQEWTSGFFPGSMWYLYELTGDEKWKNLGTKYTEAIEEVKNLTSHHDVGFMIGCSFGNALRLTGNEKYKDVIVQAAKSLSTRFRPVAGIIQSWNVTGGWQAERGWECPVIIDNMMNLELLFDATKYSGDSTFYQIAITHADKTIEHHFRDDYTTWHVIDYSLEDGSVRNKHTAQGFAHHSTWARGQSWGIYGYVVCYRETGDAKYLEQAKKAFEAVANHINMPQDKIPYWDYDAPNIPNALRDASSSAIMASALYEMAAYENREYYKGWADDIMESLASPAYRAKVGENGNFLLKHSVGSIPHGSEIDVPLNYADYYFLEALKRKRDLER